MSSSEVPGGARAPEVQVIANGQLLHRVLRAKVRSSNYFSADRFDLTIALSGSAAAYTESWWQTTDIEIDLRLRLSGTSDYVSIITGNVDLVTYDPIGRVVSLEGRDFSSRLIDAPISEAFANHTASEIATLLAQRHGLLPSVIPTATIIGRYYQSEHDMVLLERYSNRATEWDFLSFLAQQESYDTFVSGTTLYFQPIDDSAQPALTVRPTDLIRLSCERLPMLSGDVEVTVQSWNSLDHLALSETVTTAQASGASSAQSAPQRYVILHPNLTSDSARQLAGRKLKELRRHDRSIKLLMPGELSLSPRSMISLCGTSSDFDQVYRIDTIERRFSTSSGFVQSVRASNVPPGTEDG